MKKLITLLLCLGLYGCATASQLNQISIGMSKEEVIKKMGKPDSTAAIGDKEYLNYRLVPSAEPAQWANYEPYFVCIQEGKVAAFGAKGDFDSTKDPTQVIKVIGDVKSDQKIDVQTNNNELETKIKTLNKLLSDRLITKGEFDEQKKKLLNDYTSK
jgi:hypothetical protein